MSFRKRVHDRMYLVLERFPFLQRFPLVRLLVMEPLFLLAGAMTGLALALAILLLPKVWLATPQGFTPEVRISLLDRFQAWSLTRTAQRKELEGAFGPALIAWETAFANHPGDTELVRGWIGCQLRQTNAAPAAGRAQFQANWLLKLTQTNRADLPLVGALMVKSGMDHDLIVLAEQLAQPWPTSFEIAVLKARLNIGDIRAFMEHWKRSSAELTQDSSLRLYRAAFRMVDMGSTGIDRKEALAILETELSTPEQRVVSGRLLLVLGAGTHNPEFTRRGLHRLVECKQDRLSDHLVHWGQLVREGDTAGAKVLMLAYESNPATPREAVAWSGLWSSVGMKEQQEKMLVWSVHNHAPNPATSLEYAAFLRSNRRWADLAAFAIDLRSRAPAAIPLVSFSHFLEVQANWQSGREHTLDRELDFVRELGQPDLVLAVETARGLTSMGRAELAVALLQPYRADKRVGADYWQALTLAAEKARDEETLMVAAPEWYRLAPENPSAILNQINLWLVRHEQLTEALRLSGEGSDRFPASVAMRIDHAWALVANHRALDGQNLLSGIAVNRLTGPELAQYWLLIAELSLELGDAKSMLKAIDGVDASKLYPSQRQWLKAQSERVSAAEHSKLSSRVVN